MILEKRVGDNARFERRVVLMVSLGAELKLIEIRERVRLLLFVMKHPIVRYDRRIGSIRAVQVRLSVVVHVVIVAVIVMMTISMIAVFIDRLMLQKDLVGQLLVVF